VIAAYLRVKGEKSGDVRGPVVDRDRVKNGTIALLGVEHGIASPRDSASGLATGKRQHYPIIVTKEVDRTSPLFYGFITGNEALTVFELHFFGADESGGLIGGRESELYTITLTKAFVSRIDVAGRVDEQADPAARLPMIERIAFVYDSIEWKWIDGGIASKDGWSTGST
jgi:type VI secretion system secreted protein Hcp